MVISSVFHVPTQRKKTWYPRIFYNPNPGWPLTSLKLFTSLSSVTWHSPASLPTLSVSFADSSSSTGSFPQVSCFVLFDVLGACPWLLGPQRRALSLGFWSTPKGCLQPLSLLWVPGSWTQQPPCHLFLNWLRWSLCHLEESELKTEIQVQRQKALLVHLELLPILLAVSDLLSPILWFH